MASWRKRFTITSPSASIWRDFDRSLPSSASSVGYANENRDTIAAIETDNSQSVPERDINWHLLTSVARIRAAKIRLWINFRWNFQSRWCHDGVAFICCPNSQLYQIRPNHLPPGSWYLLLGSACSPLWAMTKKEETSWVSKLCSLPIDMHVENK